MILVKTIAIVATGVLIGAIVGQSGVLCPNGQCALTGTWMGGSFIGGLLGLAISGGIPR